MPYKGAIGQGRGERERDPQRFVSNTSAVPMIQWFAAHGLPRQEVAQESREQEGRSMAHSRTRSQIDKVTMRLDLLKEKIRDRLDLGTGNVEMALGPSEVVKMTRRGEFYVQSKVGSDHHRTEQQQREAEKSISFWSSRGEMELVFGRQMTQYFNFISFLTVVNLSFLLAAVLVAVPHLSNVVERLAAEGFSLTDNNSVTALDFFFLGTLQPSTDKYWFAFMGVSCALGLLTGPIYMIMATYYFKDYTSIQEWSAHIQKDPRFDLIQPLAVEARPWTNIADQNVNTSQQPSPGAGHDRERPWKLKRQRLYVSYVVFGVLLSLPLIIMYLLLIVSNNTYVQGMTAMQGGADGEQGGAASWNSQQMLVGVLSSVTVVLFNNAFELVVSSMTSFEQHTRWTSYRKHRLYKLLIYRFITVSGLFILRYFGEVPWFTCMVNRMALQAALLILTDLFITNLWALLLPLLYIHLPMSVGGMRLAALWREEGQVEIRPDFEFTDEYLKLLFRQYCMYLAFPAFPLVSAVALLSTLFDHLHSKFRLVHLCGRPKGHFMGGRVRLTVWLCFTFLGGIATFPTGALWFASPSAPFLCWPCTSYSQMSVGRSGGADEGQCAASFEGPGCSSASGVPITPVEIMSQIEEHKGGTKTSADWLSANDHLFWHRRCACRPCNLAISCRCDVPVLFERVCARLLPPNPGGRGMWNRSDVAGVLKGEELLAWRAGHCDRPRGAYSLKASLAHEARCLGGAAKGSPCSKTSDCPGGMCDMYCPSFKRPSGRRGEGSWATYLKCWMCPEDLTGGFVDPDAAKASWERLSFCSRCVAVTERCACRETCTDFY